MMFSTMFVPLALALSVSDINVTSPGFQATIHGGSLAGMRSSDGDILVRPPAQLRGASIHTEAGEHWGVADNTPANDLPLKVTANQPLTQHYRSFSELESSQITARYELDATSGDLLIRQEAQASGKGVWGVSLWIADIPLEYAILIPGTSGVRLTSDTPGAHHQYDYPLLWEVQLVVIEGERQGFYVWADDIKGRYKRLIVERHATGWRLGLYTINDAPFENQTNCQSVTWRVNTYQGDWRVPARRYRNWLDEYARPVPVERQNPSWVKDIRGSVIMPLDRPLLEQLAHRFDPEQTLVYLYDWRLAGYDRHYPDYEQMHPQLLPFIARAHALGFRVMLHVNYFGVDPLHPLYERFERYQVRSPWGAHEKQWWVWPLEDPDIRFAYINPACRDWRELFTKAMVKLCAHTDADALHLDQTLCIYNDHNGRIDGMSMLEGNIALHQQLRQALPQVALSGEGLNEITCRYEAFAQRHVWGLDHAKGTFDRRALAAAHPISSYILRPYTIMYGYLGCVSPENDQLYAAWNEAYRHWGVIPTLKPVRAALAQPSGFSRQFFDELRFWQQNRVELDLDGSWPEAVALPLRTADGRPFLATRDRRWISGNDEISHTVTDATTFLGDGNIPGCRAFNQQGYIGLDPQQWYPYFPEPRDGDVFHISQLPAALTVDYIAVSEKVAVLKTRDATPVLANLDLLLEQAEVGTRLAHGEEQQQRGPWEMPNGGTFAVSGSTLSAHPPWKGGVNGETYARFHWTVPAELSTVVASEVFLDPGAVGDDKGDGVTFCITASDGASQLSESYHQTESKPHSMTLDLTSMCGRDVDVELIVRPGDKNNPSYDWARWSQPRIERKLQQSATLGIVGGGPWNLALTASDKPLIANNLDTQSLKVNVPGAVCLLRRAPSRLTLPVQLDKDPDQTFLILDSGKVVDHSQFAGLQPGASVVGGEQRNGLRAHPPDHGRVMALYFMQLPDEPACLTSHVGLRDGAKSAGVRFSVEINGHELTHLRAKPGHWEPLAIDLSPWAGQPVALALVTDSAGGFDYDWATWGEPRVVRRSEASLR